MTNITRITIAALAVAGLAAAGCTPTARKGSAGRASQSQPYDFQKEGKVPPVEQKAQEPDVVETPVTEPEIDVEEAEAPVDTTPPAPTPKATHIDGFRVQVFASAGRDIAEGARRLAEARLHASAYVEEGAGLFKVRVGNCRTREQAEKLLEKCRSGNYPDAWIVATKIEVPMGTEN